MGKVGFGVGGRNARLLHLRTIGLGLLFLVLLEPADILGTSASPRSQRDETSSEDELDKGANSSAGISTKRR